MTCPCAFWLRRLAQNARRGSSVQHFPLYTGFCDMSSCLPTAKRPLLGSLHRDLSKTPLMEILFADLSKRPLQEICAERALIEILYRDLARRPLLQVLQRSGEERRDLAQRSCLVSLTTMRRFRTEKMRLRSSVPWPHLKNPLDSCLLFCFSSLYFTLIS